MTKEIRRLSIVMLTMFLLLFGGLSWVQVLDSENLAQHPNNERTASESWNIERGVIFAGDTPIAFSTPTDDRYQFQREYPDSYLWSHITGHYDTTRRSANTGLEGLLNADLAGTSSNDLFGAVERILSGRPAQGSSAMTTLDPEIQRVAAEALGDYVGAVMAIDPTTGRTLAMVSSPGYDANPLAVHDPDAIIEYYDLLTDDPTQPLVNRALGGDLNPPGSTFKIITAAAALESGKYTIDGPLPNPASYRLPGTSTVVMNHDRGTCGPGDATETSIRLALQYSCNIPFAEIAATLGERPIREMAEKFGFGHEFELPLAATASTYPQGISADKAALTGFGQGDVRATLLEVTLFSAALANGGVIMNPTVLDSVIRDDLSVLHQVTPSEFGRAVSAKTAQEITQALVASVESGAASSARIEGTTVAGKTGTAEHGANDPYTLWFTGFAPVENPKVAVAVVIENGGGLGQSGSGDEIAAPIAKKVIEAVLNK